MKSAALSLATILALAVSTFSAAESKKRPAGPNGGRVITAVEPPLELLITKDRKIEITALTGDFKPATISGQVITVTAGDRTKPTRLEFKEAGGKLVSTGPLPAGDHFPVSVSIKAGAGGKVTYEKFNLNLEKCPTCKYQEYACICGH